MAAKKLVFHYSYSGFGSVNITVSGRTRDELIQQLIEKESSRALYFFLTKFPDLSENQVKNIKQKLYRLEKVRSMKKFKEKVFDSSKHRHSFITGIAVEAENTWFVSVG